MQKFSKNKAYRHYPIEMIYTRRLQNRKIKKSILSSDLDLFDPEKIESEQQPLYQKLKIYGETCEI